ncbi:hypothetical protein [Nostoc sp.]|uniref:hypothetical protein n=1 Tax=Nostoc sp. TaxID=1180 RepID=UPI002FFA7D25
MPQALHNAYDHLLDFRLFNPFGLVQSLMGSHCGGRVPRHKASGVETPLALASPKGRG